MVVVMISKQAVKRKILVPAIHEDEVILLLRKINLYDKVIQGKAKCTICGKVITLENIGGFIGINGEIHLVCNNPKCLIQAARISEQEK